MPKIIENLESKLIAEAKRQIEQLGYGAVTIRSVAKACGVGVGTVYNYFSSKEELLARYLLIDWNRCISAVSSLSEQETTPEPVLRCMYDLLRDYARRHSAIFRDEAAAVGFSGSIGKYHALLRQQLAAPLQKFCATNFCAEFVAEALLTWTMAGKEFDEIFGMIDKLF